ncbi:unnamed protein product [Caenorhabditis bovis]|uniref:Aminomethyltransferase folate-binding domain-containing protein n=1 Tax=Caenorhabditis bovis TaxID=2654633 RepID=A0A8S1F229_9PELO|nr:unnamed protein product [Caenorhabditis bovis]
MSQQLIKLPHRILLRFHGPDTSAFLQGLITNDVRKLETANGIAAFLLNSKGRIVEDVLLWRRGTDDIFVECSRSNKANLIKEIAKYRLRKKVEISDCDDPVAFIQNSSQTNEFQDPRYSNFGSRVFGNLDGSENLEKYENLRRDLGIAEGASELSGLLPFQANGDLLHMVSLDKGCYIGQELTARTAHTGVIRRRILPFECEGSVKNDADIVDEKKNKVGKVISSDTTRCLGVLQLSAFKSQKLSVDGVALKAKKPEWMPDKILAANATRTSLTDA